MKWWQLVFLNYCWVTSNKGIFWHIYIFVCDVKAFIKVWTSKCYEITSGVCYMLSQIHFDLIPKPLTPNMLSTAFLMTYNLYYGKLDAVFLTSSIKRKEKGVSVRVIWEWLVFAVHVFAHRSHHNKKHFQTSILLGSRFYLVTTHIYSHVIE